MTTNIENPSIYPDETIEEKHQEERIIDPKLYELYLKVDNVKYFKTNWKDIKKAAEEVIKILEELVGVDVILDPKTDACLSEAYRTAKDVINTLQTDPTKIEERGGAREKMGRVASLIYNSKGFHTSFKLYGDIKDIKGQKHH